MGEFKHVLGAIWMASGDFAVLPIPGVASVLSIRSAPSAPGLYLLIHPGPRKFLVKPLLSRQATEMMEVSGDCWVGHLPALWLPIRGDVPGHSGIGHSARCPPSPVLPLWLLACSGALTRALESGWDLTHLNPILSDSRELGTARCPRANMLSCWPSLKSWGKRSDPRMRAARARWRD